jgi:hypothetical protein
VEAFICAGASICLQLICNPLGRIKDSQMPERRRVILCELSFLHLPWLVYPHA